MIREECPLLTSVSRTNMAMACMAPILLRGSTSYTDRPRHAHIVEETRTEWKTHHDEGGRTLMITNVTVNGEFPPSQNVSRPDTAHRGSRSLYGNNATNGPNMQVPIRTKKTSQRKRKLKIRPAGVVNILIFQ